MDGSIQNIPEKSTFKGDLHHDETEKKRHEEISKEKRNGSDRNIGDPSSWK